MRTKTAISFGLVDVTAKDDATFFTNDKQPFIDLTQLNKDELEIKKIATLEKDFFKLDGSFELFPDNPEEHDFGLWSKKMVVPAEGVSNPNLIEDKKNSVISQSNNYNLYPVQFKQYSGYCSIKRVEPFTQAVLSVYTNTFFQVVAGKKYTTSVEVMTQGSPCKIAVGGYLNYKNAITLEPGKWVKIYVTEIYSAGEQRVASLYSEDIGLNQELFYREYKVEEGDTATTDADPLIINFTQLHGSLGLTFTFDELNNDYCKELNVKWYRDNTLLSDKTFYPDNPVYFADNNINNYNKIIVQFLEMNKQHRYLKLAQIDFGQIKLFSGKDLISANLLEEIDPISSELRFNTLDFALYSKDAEFSILNPSGVYALLQQRQPLKVYEYLNGVKKKMGTLYLDDWENEDEYNINMKAIDLVGIIDGTPFTGGTYNNATAGAIIQEIMQSAKAEYELENSLANKVLSGIIKPCTHREALQQVAFAIGAIVDCSRTHKIKIYSITSNFSDHIGKNQKFEGHKLKLKTLVTGVEVVAHNYINGEDQTQVFGVYNENLSPSDKINILRVEEATLVSNSNALEVAQRLYNYYIQLRHQDDGEIILGDEECGQMVSIDAWGNKRLIGIVEKLDIDLTGGFIANATIAGSVI